MTTVETELIGNVRFKFTTSILSASIHVSMEAKTAEHTGTPDAPKIMAKHVFSLHTARSSSREDHHRALAAAIWQVLSDWKRPIGGPRHIWLCAIEADLGPLNFGLTTAWRKATTRDERRHIADTAALQWSTL